MSDLFDNAAIKRTAYFSACGKYRYCLGRRWSQDPDANMLVWIMLNPSTADAEEDDPTIRRVMSFSKAWGYGGCEVLNLFAYRETDPSKLTFSAEEVGDRNDEWIIDRNKRSRVMVAWGANGAKCLRRCFNVIHSLGYPEIMCLGWTESGHPKHPLYVPANTQPLFFC